MTRHVPSPLDLISPVSVTRYSEVDTVAALEVRTREVRLPLNAMRCTVCGHRMDDMDGCDGCESDKDEAIRQANEGDDA